ncbi:MAG TPA: MGMT family protein [Patescibacteria group bacterium]|nr:MGMT family protein [Patescibacteria group bacterium]
MKNNSFEQVYVLVRKIPKGKVSTYGIIGKKLNMSPRVIGYALHANPDSSLTPCHRVVNRDGRVAPGYAFGGPGRQREMLEAEEIEFTDPTHIDLQKYLFSF